MHTILRLLLPALILVAIVPSPVTGQYIKITTDNPLDNTRLKPQGTTTLTITLDTSHDRNGSLQACNSLTNAAGCGSTLTGQPLDMFSFTVGLQAVGGTVTWGTFTAADVLYTPVGADPMDNTSIEINRSRPTGTFTPPGVSVLGFLPVTILSGNPRIDVAHGPTTANPSGFGTGFGTECSGFNYLNTYVLGDSANPCGSGGDWFSADGTLEPIGTSSIAAPSIAVGTVGVPIDTIRATATDPDAANTLTITQAAMPSGLTFTSVPGPSPRSATITGMPGPADVGTHSVVWTVTDGAGGAATDTTVLTIQGEGEGLSVNAPPAVTGSASNPISFSVTAGDSTGEGVSSFQVFGMPPGATFLPESGQAGGTFYWTPDPEIRGTFTVTFTASNSKGSRSAATEITANTPDGHRLARVSAGLLALDKGHLDEKLLERDENGRAFVNMFITGDVSTADLAARGVSVGVRIGSRMTAHCPLDSLSALFRTPGIEAIVESGFCRLLLDSSTVDSHLTGLRAYRPSFLDFKGKTGAGAVVGIVDTGIDFTSRDFRRENGTTRIVSYWDQTLIDGPPPAGFLIGTEWDSTHINQYNSGVGTGRPGLLRKAKDLSGHGTHVAGIAAGNGRAGSEGACLERNRYIGVAPEADLCVVRVRTVGTPIGPEFFQTRVVEAVDYIFRKAGPAGLNKPAVVNLSIGSHEGPHDGKSAFDWWINSLTEKINPNDPAKIVVAAAGNNNVPPAVHASVGVKAGATKIITFDIPPYTGSGGASDEVLILHGFFYKPDTLTVRVISPPPGSDSNGHGISVGPVGPENTMVSGSLVDGDILVCQSYFNGCTSPAQNFSYRDFEAEVWITIKNPGGHPPAYGTWQIELTGLTIPDGRFDIYVEEQRGGAIPDTTSFGNTPIGFVEGADFGNVVLSPASADSVIAVGAYTTKRCWFSQVTSSSPCAPGTYGDIAPFSSHGPRRDLVRKPDITAPGQMIVSTLSDTVKVTHAIDSLYWVGNGHAALGGTSAAAPHVTGAVALLLSDDFDTSWRQTYPFRVKARLQSSARRQPAMEDSVWGAGKLDIWAATVPAYSLRLVEPRKGTVWHGTGLISVTPTRYKADSVQIWLSKIGCPYDANAIRIARLDTIPPSGGALYQFPIADSLRTMRGLLHAIAYAKSDSFPNQYIVEAFMDVVVDTTQQPTAVEVDAPAFRFALGQNAPNPFNPHTTIAFEIAKSGPVTLRVYSVDGRLVRSLIDRPMTPGRYSVRWNGTNDRGNEVASGVYFYRAVSGGRRLGKKMVVLK